MYMVRIVRMHKDNIYGLFEELIKMQILKWVGECFQ